MRRKDRDDVVAVDDVAVRVDREHPVAVAVERDAEVEAAGGDGPLQRAKVGCAAALVDVRSVGIRADRRDNGAELLERARRDLAVRAIGAVDSDLQTRQVGAEALDDVLEVAVIRDIDPVSRRRRVHPRRVALRSPPRSRR